jgi:HK97 family phage major capsid protein
MPRSAQDYVDAYRRIYAKADAESRDLSRAERERVAELLEDAKAQKNIEDLERNLGGGAASAFTDRRASFADNGGPGDIFVRSEGYKMISRADTRPESWTSGVVEVGPLSGPMFKGTLLEGATPGGGPLVQPDVRPGVVETLFQPLTIADALSVQQTTSMIVRYLNESSVTNAAAPTAEGALKPESSIALDQVDEPVRKIATVLDISDELLEDAAGIQQWLNSRLSLFIRIAEEDQLLRGNGTTPNLRGILNRTGIQTHARGADTNLDAIRKMITKARTSYVEPTFIAMHPAQSENIDLLKTTDGEYLGNPFGGGAATLWGKPVVVTNAVGAGTVLVGSRQAATIFRRGALRVEASNSHDQHFRRDLVAIRAEQREALAVFRPAAFVMGTAMA